MSERAHLAAIVSRLAGVRVAVIGDVMLDRYVYGQVDRVSPEAPIAVLRVEREQAMLGGAGNVARNLSALGAATTLVGVIGADADGAAIVSAIEQLKHVASGLVVEAQRPTTLKTRFVAGNQQLLRTDRETALPLSADSEKNLAAAIDRAVAAAQVVVLSDYAKGVLDDALVRRAIDRARDQDKPVIVDPRGSDYRRYRRASGHQCWAIQRCGLTLIESAAVPEIGFGATETRMPRLHRKRQALIPFDRSAGVISRGPFATQFVEAISFARAFVVERFGELAGFVERAPQTTVVNRLGVKSFGAMQSIEFGECVKDDKVRDGAGGRFGNCGTAGNVHDWFIGNEFPDTFGASGVRLGFGDAAKRRAVAGGDDRRRAFCRFLQQINRCASADSAIHAVVVGGNRTFDDEDVLAGVLFHRVLFGLLDLMTGGSGKCFVVLNCDGVQHEVNEGGGLRTRDGFTATGAVLEFEPDDRDALFGCERVRDQLSRGKTARGVQMRGQSALGEGWWESHTHRANEQAAHLDEFAARDATSLEMLPNRFVRHSSSFENPFVHEGHEETRRKNLRDPSCP